MGMNHISVMFFCYDCRFQYCLKCDSLVHSSGEKSFANHQRCPVKFKDWWRPPVDQTTKDCVGALADIPSGLGHIKGVVSGLKEIVQRPLAIYDSIAGTVGGYFHHSQHQTICGTQNNNH